MTEKTNQATKAAAPRPIVTTKRGQWDFSPKCPRCGMPLDGWDPMGQSEELCDSCACIEIEIENRRRQVYA